MYNQNQHFSTCNHVLKTPIYYKTSQHITIIDSLTMTTNNLKIGLWNIQGLNQDKIKDPAFLKIISNMHVFSLIETWSDS